MKGWSPLLALLGCACVQAADVPPGTPLAAEQAVVRHLKDEPASLSPQLVGLPGCRSSETFTRAADPGADGKVLPGVAASWENKDNRHSPSI
jgi:oligopeptide transport system substrate-binding protein